MKKRIVTQYCCEFCKKRNLSASHMAKHELHCTMNPNRVCRVCGMLDGVQKPILELTALLPAHPKSYYETTFEGDEEGLGGVNLAKDKEVKDEIAAALPALREACSDCPACILAAIRQAGIPMYHVTGFDFTKEMKAVWHGINEEKVMSCNGGY